MIDKSRQQKLAEIIFENIRDGIIMLDRDYSILAINNSLYKWAEKPASDLMNKNCKDVFHNNSGICPHCVAKVTFETGEVNTITQKVNIKDITYYAELSAYPTKDETVEITECVVFIQDVTERMLCHEEVLGLYKEVTFS